MLENYEQFCNEVLNNGFSLFGNAKGIYSAIPFTWEQQDNYDSPLRWHTGEWDTDPWTWRIRVLTERNDISYAKVFFKGGGFISKDWVNYFYSVRRQGMSFEQYYSLGTLSSVARRIYEIISNGGAVAYHEIKWLGGFAKEDNQQFEKALIELQSAMFITMCGQSRKLNKQGEEYGWSSTVFTTVEEFWRVRGVEVTFLDAEYSADRIRTQVLSLNPEAKDKDIVRFIKG